MRSFFTGLAALAMAVIGTVEASADKLQDILSKGVVRIGVPLDAPPFGSQDASRKPVGFDIEMAEMVAKALGVKLEMQQITGANRIPFLLTATYAAMRAWRGGRQAGGATVDMSIAGWRSSAGPQAAQGASGRAAQRPQYTTPVWRR